VAPRVAAKLDVAQISDVTQVISADTFERPIYAGNAMATVQSTDATKVITVRTTGFDAAAATGGSAAVESAAAQADSGQSAFKGSEIAKNDRPELTAAKIIVSGGRALGSSEKFNEVMTPLADKLAPPSVPAVPRWTPVMPPTTCRWARPARSLRLSCMSLAASRARSSTWQA